MKLRVKLSGLSRLLDLGEETEISSLTLGELKVSVSELFLLSNRNIELSLNKKDVLSGDDAKVADLGLVPGDLVHVITEDEPQPVPDPPVKKKQCLTSYSHATVVLDTNQHANPMDDEINNGAQGNDTQFSSPQASIEAAGPSGQENVVEDQMHFEDIASQSVRRSLDEPLVIGESTAILVPALLQEIYSNAQVTSPNDALFILLHALMIESGFSNPENGDVSRIPLGWKRSGFYTLIYEYFLGPDAKVECSLIAVPTGASMAVHGLSKTIGNFKTNHLQLKADNYVRDIAQENAAVVFRSLDRVSNLFKDSISLPLQNHLSTSAGFRETNGLLSLPCEVRIRLMSFLDAVSVCRLGQTCHQWNSIYKDNSVWRRFYLLSFETPDDTSFSRNWYELFKERCQEFIAQQKRYRRMIINGIDDNFPSPSFPFGPFNPFRPNHPLPPPRFLGGDYDLNPAFTPGLPNLLNGRRGPTGAGGSSLGSTFGRVGGGRGNMTGSPFMNTRPFL